MRPSTGSAWQRHLQWLSLLTRPPWWKAKQNMLLWHVCDGDVESAKILSHCLSFFFVLFYSCDGWPGVKLFTQSRRQCVISFKVICDATSNGDVTWARAKNANVLFEIVFFVFSSLWWIGFFFVIRCALCAGLCCGFVKMEQNKKSKEKKKKNQ